MSAVLIIVLSFFGYILAYRFYGKHISEKVLRIGGKREMPSHKYRDGVDFVPTSGKIIFGHHFTTIAGLGPIVGPAIGIIWGWLPALLWIFFGSIFMGAVHDFTSLIISARNDGKTIGELTGKLISREARLAFQFIMQLLLFIVLAVFAAIVASLFIQYPESVIPVWFQIPIAIWLGKQVGKGRNYTLYSVFALILMYVFIVVGVWFPISLPFENNIALVIWVIILFVYVFVASTLPVQKLLQPRDNINSYQLILAMTLMVIGFFVARPEISAPAINHEAFLPDSDVPALAPIMFIIIACGAISGFHSLASSGTTVKQLDKEKDAQFIAYGGMLTESFLAVLVLFAIAAGLGMGLEENGEVLIGKEAFYSHYSSWSSANGLTSKLDAFITGTSNLFASFGIPPIYGKSLIAVFIVSFANTTLDSATRIQRLSLQEIFTSKEGKISWPFDNRYFATFVIILFAAIITFLKPGGKGAMMLWPLFGSLNQLLAALALGVVSVYLYIKKINVLYTLIPMIFVLLITVWAMVENLLIFIDQKDVLLTILSLIVLILTSVLLLTGFKALIKNERKV